MSKPFKSVKHGLALLDFFNYGKYSGCRVDSIVSQFPDYILYTHKELGTMYTKEVLAECEYAKQKLARQAEETKKEDTIKFHATWSAASVFDDPEILDEDVPF